MPAEKPLTIATYAAGASFAAIALVYVFGPTYFLDGNANPGVKAASKRAAIGLYNPANDCFINSVLQALAGLSDLRKYLIRETHRRKLDGDDLYKVTAADIQDGVSEAQLLKLGGLRSGIVTQALKDMLDKLNERPIYKKTISAQEFVAALETAFRTRISRQQQDAQELLQVVVERVCDEYHAGKKARKQALAPAGLGLETMDGEKQLAVETNESPQSPLSAPDTLRKSRTSRIIVEEDGFPLEGQLESQIECQSCGFKPKPSVSSFVTLTLNVPQQNSTTLNQCFDGMLKVEVIEDYKCDRCRLEHALKMMKGQLGSGADRSGKGDLESDIRKIEQALEDDPEKPPEGVKLPDLKLAPKRTIKKHMRIAHFPQVLAIHLSRSIYAAGQYSTKNMAKVAFPETLPLGGILQQKQYRLVGIVNHKGGHNSGHYETFRRQPTVLPFSTPHNFGAEGAYSQRGSPNPSAVASPALGAQSFGKRNSELSTTSETSTEIPTEPPEIPSQIASPSPRSPSPSPVSSRSSFSMPGSKKPSSRPPTSTPREELVTSPTSDIIDQPPAKSSIRSKTRLSMGDLKSRPSLSDLARFKKPKRNNNRWWRISDDKVKESKTSEVLGMQKEVYLLMYELIPDNEIDEASVT